MRKVSGLTGRGGRCGSAVSWGLGAVGLGGGVMGMLGHAEDQRPAITKGK